MGMTPEAAKGFAQQGVAIGFCVIAIGTDLFAEARAANRGEVTVAGAVGGMAAKTALDLLPLVMAPLGLAGLPILVGTQIGGRWLIAKAREADRVIEKAIAEDLVIADCLEKRMAQFTDFVKETNSNCDDSDEIFWGAMGAPAQPAIPKLQLVMKI
jgi:hypothetical protein